jgi:NAD(P)H-nitrite reductase large subunit
MSVDIQVIHCKTKAPIWKHLRKILDQIPHETIKSVQVCTTSRVHSVKGIHIVSISKHRHNQDCTRISFLVLTPDISTEFSCYFCI